MLTDRRPFWFVGLGIGILLVVFFLTGPKKSADQRVAEDVAILAREPWHAIHVSHVDFRGSSQNPSDVFVYGARPDGTPVVVQFAEGCPYTSATAMRRLSEQSLAGRTSEFLLVARSMVEASWKQRFDEKATHAGIAMFAGIVAPPESEVDAMDATPASTHEEDSSQAGNSTDGGASHH
jgi:hypothetical protein